MFRGFLRTLRSPTLNSSIGTARIEWSSLGFDYVPTSGFVEFDFKDGKWSEMRFVREPYVRLHVLANVFHYGQSVFEGLKAFHTKQGDVRVFSDRLNFERLLHSSRRLQIPEISWDMWKQGVNRAVVENYPYVPPYGTNGSLYIRPLIIGSGPRLGLGPANEYKFLVITNPVGTYYPNGRLKALDAVIPSDFDRCAPKGIGDAKAAANYAGDLQSLAQAKAKGYPVCLYLDAKERRYVTEFNTSNFVAITRDNKYVTPNADRGVLNSVTNRLLGEISEKLLNMKVERRPVDFRAEVDNWKEVGAVGTAVVITPMQSVTLDDRKFLFDAQAPKLQHIHDLYRAIQVGDEVDHFHWLRPVTD